MVDKDHMRYFGVRGLGVASRRAAGPRSETPLGCAAARGGKHESVFRKKNFSNGTCVPYQKVILEKGKNSENIKEKC